MISGITIGSDPEFFVLDGEDIGAAIGKIGGDKANPLPVANGAIQEDNVLAELNIDPASSVDEFIHNLHSVMSQLSEVVGPLKIQSSHEYLKETLMSYGHTALEFGCDPDYNAWTSTANRPPSPFTTMRTAGGHLHIGYDGVNEDTNRRIIQMCDILLGVPSVVMEPECKRRAMYGGAGSMRHKPYGVEYRTLSNFWLKSDVHMAWAYNSCVQAARTCDVVEEYVEAIGGADVIQSTINDNDVASATKICDTLGLAYV